MATYTGAESIDYIIEKFKKNRNLLVELKRQLQSVTSQIYMKSHASTTFCHRFNLPMNLPTKLFKIYGIPPEKLKDDFRQLGFQKNRMYEDTYYQAIMVLYLTGLYLKDIELRKMALFLMLIKLYNGRVYTYFRLNCDDDIANYVIRMKLRNSSLFKNKTPLEFLAYYIDTLDEKYAPLIKQKPNEYAIRLFMQAWGRLNQVFKTVAQLYYEAYRKGEKDITVQTVAKDEQGMLNVQDSLLESAIELIIDKFKKAHMIKPVQLPAQEKQYLAQKMIVTQQSIDKIEEYLNNSRNLEQISQQLLYLLKALNVRSENDVHKLPIIYSVDKVMGKKGEINSVHFKNLIDESLGEIFGQVFMKSISVTQRLKLRKLYGYILFYQLKAIISKTKEFERAPI